MRKGILFSLLSLIAIVSVACGPANNAANAGNAKSNAKGGNGAACTGGANSACTGGGDTGGGDTGGGSKVDGYALYKKQGRSWMHKTVSKMGDMPESISYTQYEITKVTADEATMKMTMLDQDKKPNQYVPPSETPIKFVTATTTDTGGTPVVQKEESVEVLGKKWDAYVTETETSGMKTKSWSSKEFPGLLLKSTTTGETAGMKMDTTMELVEWKE